MNKVICDVCGTAYPETASVCPICNSARKSAEQTDAATTMGEVEVNSHSHVKGGRFSKKNVRKRSKGGNVPAKRHDRDEEEPSNTGLIIVVVLLLLAIIAVVIYIGVHFFAQGDKPNNEPTGPSYVQPTDDTKGNDPTVMDVPCQSIQLSNKVIEFMNEGESWTLEVACNPVSTTDTVTFTSSDPSVVTVAADGTITAVGGGEAIITVTCGSIVDTCTVTCSFGQVEDPTEGTTGTFFFEFNTAYTDSTTGYGDTTLNGLGATWRAYKKNLTVPLDEITWTSDDTSVCTISDGIVTVVGNGKTLIHAQYNGVTYSCIVRCVVKDNTGTTTEPNDPSDGNEPSDPTEPSQGGETTVTYVINKTDVTIAVGETFKLTLSDSLGFVQEVTWTADGTGVSIDGNKITGVYSGKFTVSVTIDGTTYSCIVRVK